ncbi:hypothetical protein MTY66_47960 [Mycolicibacterium sp. TY66]|uniref:hypothetical protein n=1 Tax=Mycobacteriaceae TaxID=1762 RepID=UPI001BB4446D|nr:MULTISPECIES: hypothetical protein [unclassified Mycolicibacterium]BCI83171.1 hypothetical protein MTY66_47960 [Mycolicibacterium sp. TY66]BCJ79183.1 hypothetical protein MTY81_05560 [Mycolicibacterium sp. TY81]
MTNLSQDPNETPAVPLTTIHVNPEDPDLPAHGARGVRDERSFLQRKAERDAAKAALAAANGDTTYESACSDIPPPSPPVDRPPTGGYRSPDDPYVVRAMELELAELASLASDSHRRNSTLNTVALKLARLSVPRDQLRAELIKACNANGLVRDDGMGSVLKTIRSAFGKADREGQRVVPDMEPLGTVTEVDPSAIVSEGQESIRELPDVAPITLDQAHAVSRKWLGEDYDTDAQDAVLAAAAAERLPGDPLWLLVISGSGNAKTETVQALDGVDAVVISAITSDAALLSATPKRERSKGATGGLLRRIGSQGVLVIKDVTSILSMNRDLRAKVLAALREIHDGRWSREVGTDGGNVLHWSGRIVVIGACTTAWDSAHSVIASMGDRFVLVRMDSTTKRIQAGRKAIGNTGHEVDMRAELAEAAAGVIAGMNTDPVSLSEAESEVLLNAANLVTLTRTAVEYDYRGDVIDAHAPEMPTRFAKQLAQLVRGGVAIGMDRTSALRLAIRCARDSMPPLRLAILDDLVVHPDSTATDIRKRLNKPRATVDRQLQALHMLGALDCTDTETHRGGRFVTTWFYRLADDIEPSALDPSTAVPDLSVQMIPVPDLSLHIPRPPEELGSSEGEDGSELWASTNKSGTALDGADS